MRKDLLLQKIAAFVSEDEKNVYNKQFRVYDNPLVGFAAADDPLFEDMKNEGIIGPMFRTPKQWLHEAKTVISFFLPFTETVRRSNHASGLASDEWMHGRFFGEEFANHLRRHIVKELQMTGARAMAPLIDPCFQADFTIYASNWSERHVAYIAGLGTFSLNRGLITEKGMAGRIGSVITDLVFEPTPRSYQDPFQHCLFTREGKCGACIKRCPTQAITENGKDKYKCHQYLFIQDPRKDFNKVYGYPYSACGKCQTKVPCETIIP